MNFQHFARSPLPCSAKSALRAGKKGKFRTAANKSPGGLRRGGNRPGRFEVDSKRLLSQEILPRLQHVEINWFVKIVWDGNVDDVDFRAVPIVHDGPM